MPVQTVTLPDGRTLNLELTQEEWDSAAPPATPPPAHNGESAARSDEAWADMRRENVEGRKAIRALAFLQAGLDVTKPQVQDFVAAYSGDLDVDKIKAAAVERGYLATPPDPNAPPTPTPDQAQATAAGAAISTAANGASIDTPSEVDQLQAAYDAGGTAGMIAKAKELGVTVDEQQDHGQATDAPGGWGASSS